MNTKKWAPFMLVAILAIVTIVVKQCRQPSKPKKEKTVVNPVVPVSDNDTRRFSRNIAELFFTKHARCRMKCRHITQKEVKEILASGTINYTKSDLNATDGPRYALEGLTSDKQKVRIIFAPKQKHMSVVTVIDLGTEWPCPSCD